MGKGPSNEDIQNAYMYMKRCSSSLVIREKQTKTVSYLLEWSPSKKRKINNKHECGCRGKGTLHCWWDYELAQPLWETVRRILKN